MQVYSPRQMHVPHAVIHTTPMTAGDAAREGLVVPESVAVVGRHRGTENVSRKYSDVVPGGEAVVRPLIYSKVSEMKGDGLGAATRGGMAMQR
jgi:hypothetical protein